MIKKNSRNKLSLKQLVSAFVGEGWGRGGNWGEEAGGRGGGSPGALGIYRLPKHSTYVNYFDH